ncbi:MAG: metabolite traffic protein EboE [Alphaproteobacteria bacterium]|nr:metabolite traffic protein EboE [Alphaproteobacteria bacterium]
MRLGAGASHLTYCTNIHPGETWAEVRANLGRYVPAVKKQVAPDRDFGVGLRLSAAAAAALAEPEALAELKDFLRREHLYVFTINAFPYGVFHHKRVKEEVYLPDWRDPERLRYSNQAADLLFELLPPHAAVEGSVSTVPGAFKAALGGADDVVRIAAAMIDHVAHLVRLHRTTGRTIALALEPEPCCMLETVAETVAFFQTYVFSHAGIARLAAATGLGRAEAEQALHRHLGVCLDLCHAAVEFEDAADCVRALRAAGIRIAKAQISAGLRFAPVTDGTRALLMPFDDGVYLHQVVERNGHGLRRFTDLDEAFAASDAHAEREWRVHCHVPIFLDGLGAYGTTQGFIRDVLAAHRREPVSDHLEVETYTWDVLPERFRNSDVVTAVSRELAWAARQAA